MKYIKLLGLFALMLTLAACNAEPEQTLAQVTVEPTAAAVETTPTFEPQTDYCLDCHTDKDQLIQTAKTEEVVESESEGVG